MIQHNQCTIQDDGQYRLNGRLMFTAICADLRKQMCHIMSVTADELNGIHFPKKLSTESVIFHFIDPFSSGRGLCSLYRFHIILAESSFLNAIMFYCANLC